MFNLILIPGAIMMWTVAILWVGGTIFALFYYEPAANYYF